MKELPKEPTDLVWLQTAFLGDMVLTTAAIRLGMDRFPGARHHLISTPLGCEALRALPGLSSRVEFRKKDGLKGFFGVRRRLFAGLSDPRRAVLLQAHRSVRSGLLASLIGLPVVSFRETAFQPFASARVPRVSVFHEAARIAMLLEPLGALREQILAARPMLPPLPLDDEVPWQRALNSAPRPTIGFSPGSVWGTKRWTTEGFAELASRLAADSAFLVMLGSAGEKHLTEEIVKLAKLPAGSFLNLAGETSLEDLRRIYPRLDLLVSNDSSPIHYASAFQVPTVAVFGATIPEMGFGPLAPGSSSVGVDLDCRPCSDHGPKECPLGHFRCMRDLTAETVYAATKGTEQKMGRLVPTRGQSK